MNRNTRTASQIANDYADAINLRALAMAEGNWELADRMGEARDALAEELAAAEARQG